MANPFEITAATNTVALDNRREGVGTFTVRNLTRRRVRAVGKLMPIPAESPAVNWITILPAEASGTPSITDVRDIAIDAAQQYQVRVAAPANAAPGSYAFRLVVADEINPDENFTQSPDVTFTVQPPPVEEKKPLPRWLLPLIIAIVLVVIAAIALVLSEQNRQATLAREATETLEAARLTADASTAQAIAQSTATAQVQLTMQAATRSAFARYTGSWQPTVENPSALRGLNIAEGSNGRYNLTYTSNCPPSGNVCLSQPQTFSISGVAYDPNRLVAAIQNTVITLEPTSDGGLLSRTIIGANETTQLLRPARIRIPDLDIMIRATMVPDIGLFLNEREFDLNFLRVTLGP